MSLDQAQWSALASRSGPALFESAFAAIQTLAREIQLNDEDDPRVLTAIPRLAELVDTKPELKSLKPMFSVLARAVGLWNYIDEADAPARVKLVAETAAEPTLGGLVLHREQVRALRILERGHNLVLSAPTSFGKSALIDVLLASGRYETAVIVVPTIALLDETRRRLQGRFRREFQIVTHASQNVASKKVIIVGTQERLLARKDFGNVDLVVVDEFYKLDEGREDERSATLNATTYNLLKRARQFFFIGPNIDDVVRSDASRWRFEFLRTRVSTVAVNVYDRSSATDPLGTLAKESSLPQNWPALAFVSSPDKANVVAEKLRTDSPAAGAGEAFAEWIENNFGQGWSLSGFLRHGIGIHHGRIPRAVAAQVVRLFNDGTLPRLVCTSTLIEGVNTAAKSVFVVDAKINKKNYDYFTFSNIRGRAGRLGRHRVGSVFLFHEPPQQTKTTVEAPIFMNLENAPDQMAVQFTGDDATLAVQERIRSLSASLGLSGEELALALSVGTETAMNLREEVRIAHESPSRALFWHGYGRYDEIRATCDVICAAKAPNSFGVTSGGQLAFYINELRKKRSFRDFMRNHSATYKGRPDGQDNVIKFLRACEHGLPQLFELTAVFCRQFERSTNYNLVLAQLPRWFRPEVLKELDEQGAPIQIAERYYRDGDTREALIQRLLERARGQSRPSDLTDFEAEWVVAALADG